MEWRKASGAASTSASNEASNNGGFGGYTEGMVVDGGLYVKVMTDEQMEVLRRQIAVYATICEDLVKLHKAVTAQQDSLAGMRLGSIYCDPMVMCGGVPKITARQRWTPTPMQLQILESIFDKGNGTPSKQKIKEITSELLHHGHVSETNVYNWFQNRRARSKRKQTTIAAPVKSESEAEGDTGSSDEKKAKFEKTNSFQSPEVSSEMHSIEKTNSLNDNSKSCGSLAQLSFYEESLSNPRMNRLLGKMGIPKEFDPTFPRESYSMLG